MPLIYEIGSSHASVMAFGATSAAYFDVSGLVNWMLAAWYIAQRDCRWLYLPQRSNGTRAQENSPT
ncbi:MAG: hypothetical protein JSS54_08260 [Proteobacteria bacterium]|nr:hypothetical protein [Pseudomonadota bacterium]